MLQILIDSIQYRKYPAIYSIDKLLSTYFGQLPFRHWDCNHEQKSVTSRKHSGD